jgi:hypothetical protein
LPFRVGCPHCGRFQLVIDEPGGIGDTARRLPPSRRAGPLPELRVVFDAPRPPVAPSQGENPGGASAPLPAAKPAGESQPQHQPFGTTVINTDFNTGANVRPPIAGQGAQAGDQPRRQHEVTKATAGTQVKRTETEAVRPGASLSNVPAHISCERHNLGARLGLLKRLRASFDRGLRDPELLYLGGRYAVSLGLEKEACRFLDCLAPMLRESHGPTAAFFPVGLLYLQILPPGERRDTILRELHSLCSGSPRLTQVLQRVGLDPEARVLADSPHRLLQDIESERLEFDPAVLRLLEPSRATTGEAASTVTLIQQFASRASNSYRAGELTEARRALEALLLEDGDQPDVLRNLVTITSEQEDGAAHERYWRRYVKVLLWRQLRGDEPLAAWHDLVRFYRKVATITDCEFSGALIATKERLRLPGLLPRWVEAHAALVWLESAARSYRFEQTGLPVTQVASGQLGRLSLMNFWFGVFYPEFKSHLCLGRPGPALGHPGEMAQTTAVPFEPDPALHFLSRFVEWSKAQFALKNDDEAHAQAVLTLAGCAARIPPRPYVRQLQAILNADEIRPRPFRRSFQEACSLPLGIRLEKLLKEQDWDGLISCYGDPETCDSLVPMLRLFAALAFCKVGQPVKALELSCEALPDLEADELAPNSQCRALWDNVFHANLNEILKGKPSEQENGIKSLRRKIEGLPDLAAAPDFKPGCLAEIREIEDELRLNKQIDQAVASVKELVGKERFEEARRAVRALPDQPVKVQDLKKNFLRQIDEVEEQSRLRARIDAAAERLRGLLSRRNYAEATTVVNDLPDHPAEIRQLKTSWLTQIEDAQRQAFVLDAENTQILLRLRSRGLNYEALKQTAKKMNIDLSDPAMRNALLKAAEERFR